MENGETILVSACLAGCDCNYQGKNKRDQRIVDMLNDGKVQVVCPEYLGGLEIPRNPSEIQGYSGECVIDGKCKILDNKGKDVTANFIKGAEMTLEVAQMCGVTKAILKARSSSCGCGEIYDGTFSDKIIKGDGVTAALLKRNGIEVFTEENYKW